MKLHWTELLPVDRFAVRVTNQLGDREYKTLNLLYQPLIGPVAISLYNTLSSRLEKDCFWSEEATHHELMALLGMPLDDIFDARRVLEGIGLLRTFRRSEEASTLFVYELQMPLSPAQFFQDDVLSVYLYNKLGKKRYVEMRNRFMIDIIDEREYKEITATFNEVFTSLHYSEMMIMKERHSEGLEHKALVGEEKSNKLTLDENSFDFQLLKADLPAFIDKEKLLTEKVCAVIQRLAFVYKIGPLDMSKIIQQSLTPDDELNEKDLRKKVQEWYRFEHSSEPPALGLRTQLEELQVTDQKEPVGEKEKMKRFYEQTSPLTFLKSISDGAHVPQPDIRLVEMLIFDYQLQPGVVNVLIDFIMQTNNMKLNKNLVQKVAGHWSRKKVDTVNKAMELAKREYQERKDREQTGSGQSSHKPTFSASPYVRKDKLPKWLESENKKDQNEQPKEQQESSQELHEEMQEFEEMLRMRRSIRQR